MTVAFSPSPPRHASTSISTPNSHHRTLFSSSSSSSSVRMEPFSSSSSSSSSSAHSSSSASASMPSTSSLKYSSFHSFEPASSPPSTSQLTYSPPPSASPLLRYPDSEFTPLLSLSPPFNKAHDVKHLDSSHSSTGRAHFWQPASAIYRWLILSLAILIPFGPHFIKNSLSSLAPLIFNDWSLTHAQFGAFQSAVSLPNLFVPILGGMFLDFRGSRGGTLLFLAVAFLGHAMFCFACSNHMYSLALFSRAVYGLGQATSVVAQGRIVATFFQGREIVFAVALCEAFHNLSGMSAKVLVVPVAVRAQDWIAPLILGLFFCTISCMAGLIFFFLNPPDIVPRHQFENNESEEESSGDRHPWRRLRGQMPITFLLLCLLHLVQSNSVHLFDYVSTDFLHSKFDLSLQRSALFSAISASIAIFFCPMFGYLTDRTGGKMHFVAVAAALTAFCYVVLAITSFWPILPLALMSFSVAIAPTVLRAAVPDCVHRSNLGLAYAVYEVVESIGAATGHVLVGFVVDVTRSYQLDILFFAALATIASIVAVMLSIVDAMQHGSLNKATRSWSSTHHTPSLANEGDLLLGAEERQGDEAEAGKQEEDGKRIPEDKEMQERRTPQRNNNNNKLEHHQKM